MGSRLRERRVSLAWLLFIVAGSSREGLPLRGDGVGVRALSEQVVREPADDSARAFPNIRSEEFR